MTPTRLADQQARLVEPVVVRHVLAQAAEPLPPKGEHARTLEGRRRLRDAARAAREEVRGGPDCDCSAVVDDFLKIAAFAYRLLKGVGVIGGDGARV